MFSSDQVLTSTVQGTGSFKPAGIEWLQLDSAHHHLVAISGSPPGSSCVLCCVVELRENTDEILIVSPQTPAPVEQRHKHSRLEDLHDSFITG